MKIGSVIALILLTASVSVSAAEENIEGAAATTSDAAPSTKDKINCRSFDEGHRFA